MGKVIIIILCIIFISYNEISSPSPIIINSIPLKEISCLKEVRKFMDAVAQAESNNRLGNVSKLGYLGKYQFSITTLKGLGFTVTKEEFLQNKHIQDSAMVTYMRYNEKILRRYIKKYAGTTVDNVYITKAGILAAAHLLGAGGPIEFFNREGKYDTVDGNGVDVKVYLRKFGKYKIGNI